LINQLRALLLERGITAPQGRRKLERLLSEILAEEDNGLGSGMRRLIEDMRSEWRGLDERITAFDDELAEPARADEAARRLVTIPESSPPRRLWRRSATPARSLVAVTWQHGWGWHRARQRRAVSRGCWASASGATATCGCC
jgi:transposase